MVPAVAVNALRPSVPPTVFSRFTAPLGALNVKETPAIAAFKCAAQCDVAAGTGHGSSRAYFYRIIVKLSACTLHCSGTNCSISIGCQTA